MIRAGVTASAEFVRIDDRIQSVYAVVNPDKLAAVQIP